MRHVHNEALDGLILPSYRDVHIWLRQWRGKASDHACQDCGAKAYAWAFDNEQPSWPSDNGSYYPDPNRYVPLCGSCHGHRDRSEETCANGHRWADGNRYRRKDGKGTICRACRREAMRRYSANKREGVITNDDGKT